MASFRGAHKSCVQGLFLEVTWDVRGAMLLLAALPERRWNVRWLKGTENTLAGQHPRAGNPHSRWGAALVGLSSPPAGSAPFGGGQQEQHQMPEVLRRVQVARLVWWHSHVVCQAWLLGAFPGGNSLLERVEAALQPCKRGEWWRKLFSLFFSYKMPPCPWLCLRNGISRVASQLGAAPRGQADVAGRCLLRNCVLDSLACAKMLMAGGSRCPLPTGTRLGWAAAR